MKTIAKRLFATVLALALICTMVTGFAANTASVTKIEILSDAETVIDTPYDISIPEKSNLNEVDISVVEGQIIKVYTTLTTTEVTGEGEEAVESIVNALGDITFLSADFTKVLGNNSIQYVAQQTVVDGATVFTFRPRATLGTGTFGAKVGGTGVAAATTFSYDVEKAIVTLNLTAQDATSIQENDTTTNIVYTLDNYTTGDLTVTLDENVLTLGEGYTIEGTTLTILNVAIPKNVADYTLTVSGAGYTAATATISVTEKPDVQLALEAIRATVQENADENIEFSIGGYVAGTALTVVLTKDGETVEADYEIATTNLVIKNKAVGNYTVTVSGDGYIADSAEFEVTKKPDDELTLSAASPVSIEEDDTTTNIVFTVGGIVAEQPITVALGEVTLEAGTHYTLEGTTLTILNATISKTIDTYTVTVSGTGYKAASATFDVVADSSVQLGLIGVTTELREDNEETDVVYTLVDYTEGDELTVEIDGTVVAATVEGTTLTIPNASLVKTLGNHNVRVSGVGYYAATATYTVTKKPAAPDDPIGDEMTGDAQDAINNLDPEVSVDADGVIESVTLKDKVQVGETEYNVTNEVVVSDAALTYDVNSGVISYNPEADGAHFVSKAVVTTSISSTGSIKKTETIYFIPKDTKITFGNVTAIAAADGTDAFNEANFAALDKNNEEVLAAQAEALNVVLGRKDKSKLAQQRETLDYDQDTVITLSEYKIYRYMMLGKDGYDWNTVHDARDRWIAINGVSE